MPPRASRRGSGQVPGRRERRRHRGERRSQARRRAHPARLPRRRLPLQRAARGLGRRARGALREMGIRGRRQAPRLNPKRRRLERQGRDAMHRARARAPRRTRRIAGPSPVPRADATRADASGKRQEGWPSVLQLRVHQPRHAAHATRAQRRALAVQRVRALVRAPRDHASRRGWTRPPIRRDRHDHRPDDCRGPNRRPRRRRGRRRGCRRRRRRQLRRTPAPRAAHR